MAHRFMLPAVGIFVILGDVLQKVCGENRRRLYMTTAVLVVVFGSVTNLHALRYRDSEIFFRKETEAHPKNIYLQNLRVSDLMTAHIDFRAALELLNQEPLLSDTSYKTHFNRGLALLGLRRYAEAITDFDRYIALAPKPVDALISRSEAKRLSEDLTGAQQDIARARRMSGIN